MPRKVTASLVRPISPDRQYNSVMVQRLINRVMLNGKKQLAERLVYNGMQKAADKLKVQNPLEVFDQAMKNVQPHMETRSRRVGGANYQVPIEVKPARRQSLATRWLIDSARGRGEQTMAERLAMEIIDASNQRGVAMKKREDMHRMAEANKAFAHFRW